MSGRSEGKSRAPAKSSPAHHRRARRPVAVVTGASRGIGAAIALELARAGCDLALTSTRAGGTRAVAKRAAALGAVVLERVYLSQSRPSADALVRAVLRTFGPPSVLVNNAGVVVRKPLAKMADDDFDDVLKVNLSGPFYLCRRFLPRMLRGATVVNLSSISATLGNPLSIGYCASKWGLDGLMKSLAAAFPQTGVRVLSVLPGSVDTDMLKGSGFKPLMSPAAVAKVVRFAALEAPDSINGSRLELFG